MLKFGTITQVDAAKGMARVTFRGDDNMLSGWLPMSMPKTKEDKFIIPFDVNEHVWCMMDENMEYGVICGAIYDEANASTGGAVGKTRVQFVGGLWLEHDRQTNILAIGGTGDVKIDINGAGKGKVTIKCNEAVIESLTSAEIKAVTQIKLTAPSVLCSGTLQATAIGIGGTPPAVGNISVTGDMTVTGSITGAQVNEGVLRLGTHKHTGVTTGAGTSGTPIP